MNHLFCLVSSKVTENYTKVALDTFFKFTKLEKEDLFIFINNDSTNSFKNNYPIDIYINNNTQLNWSQNFNQGLKLAKEKKMHFVVLTNDIMFTKGWFEPLKQKDDAILVPSCNVNYMYKNNGFNTGITMKLNEILNKEHLIEEIVEFHQRNNDFYKLEERIFLPLFLARIPFNVYNEVGFFDEKFHLGGEDMDYRFRAAIKGFKTMLAIHSYVIHFHGKSTWDGQETSEQELNRRNNYIKYSLEKWGENFTEIFIRGINAKEWCEKIGLKKELENNESFNIMRKINIC